MALALPESKIISVESDPTHAKMVQELAKKYDCKNLFVQIKKVGPMFLKGGLFRTYLNVDLPNVVDVVLIDGPPYFIEGGREACLYLIFDRIPAGGIIFLDDARRDGEQQALKNWERAFKENIECQFLPTEKGMLLVKKVKSNIQQFLPINIIARSYIENLLMVREFSTFLRKLVGIISGK
jgi:predicted O-methyltransferase YrrM